MKGPHMLPYLVGFVNLRELDLSAPSRTGFGSTSSTPLILSDKDIVAFFNTLNNHFRYVAYVSLLDEFTGNDSKMSL